MKKRMLLAATLLTFVLAGCSSSSPASSADPAEIEKLEDRIDELEKENAELKAQLEASPDADEAETQEGQADEGNVYLHVDADVKNLGKQNLSCEKIMKVTADYNNGYTYKGSPIPEDSDTGFTYANITSIKPLDTLGVHFLFKCPQEVEETDYPLFLTLEPADSDDSYILTVR